MISKQEFFKLFEKIEHFNKSIDELEKILKAPIYEMDLIQTSDWFMDQLKNSVITDEQIDTVNEFLYGIPEYGENNPLIVTIKINDVVSKVYEIKDIETLYNYLTENNGLRASY